MSRPDDAPFQRVLDLLPPLIADFLASDVRRDGARCAELLAGLERARAGEPFAAFGNVYELSAEGDRAILRNSHDPEVDEVHLSLTALVNVLIAWQEAIAQAAATCVAKSCSTFDQPA